MSTLFGLTLALLALLAAPARADSVRVAVAGNFLPALERLAPDFEAQQGHRLSLSAGSTGKLYAQIRQGAPFDVFLAADARRPRRLEADGLTVPGTRVTYARGRLVLWAPQAAPGEDLVRRLQAVPRPRVALANPRLAPYGAAAEAWLRDRELWEGLSVRAVRGESVAQAWQFVASGNADLGLVALSQLRLASATVTGQWLLLPSREHPPIEQQAVLLRDIRAGRELLAWLLSPGVQERLRTFGYDPP